MKLSSNPQTKNQPYPDQTHPIPAVTTSPPNVAHSQLTKISARLPHQEPEEPRIKSDPQSIRQQTHTALASLIFAKNNNCPQLIWRLRLLRLQQQQLLSDQTPHQQQRHPHQHQHPLTLDLNKSSVVYTTPCAVSHQTLEDLAGLEDLADLVDLVDPEDQELLKDPLRQHRQQETPMIGLWETSPRYLMETENLQGPSSTIYSATSEQTLESLALIHRSEKYPSHSCLSKDHK
jgi:hypothetical protein